MITKMKFFNRMIGWHITKVAAAPTVKKHSGIIAIMIKNSAIAKLTTWNKGSQVKLRAIQKTIVHLEDL